MFNYLCSLRAFNDNELEVVSTLVEICAKYDELEAEYRANPTDKLLAASRTLDQMRWDTAKSIGLATLHSDFTNHTRHVFCLRSELLATIE
jgi:hypothetical protein